MLLYCGRVTALRFVTPAQDWIAAYGTPILDFCLWVDSDSRYLLSPSLGRLPVCGLFQEGKRNAVRSSGYADLFASFIRNFRYGIADGIVLMDMALANP